MFYIRRISQIGVQIFCILASFILLFSYGCEKTEQWVKKADMPTPRLGHSTCVVNGKIYAIGGYQKANAPGLTTVEVYDPSSDTWTSKAPMPTGRRQLTLSVVNGKIYAIGGYTNFRQPGLSTVVMYDPEIDTWTTKSNMPTPRLGLTSSVVNGIIFVIGGALTIKPPHPAVSTVEVFIPAN
jgi:N-acetylneuraminic acid mutarotase